MSNDEEWLEGYEAAERLGRTERQVYRYGTTGRVRTRKVGRRTQYHASDVDRVAEELGSDAQPRPPREPRQEIMPPSAMLDYLRERDRQLEQAQHEIQRLIYELGQRDSELSRRALPEDVESMQNELETLRQERNQLQQELERVQAEQAEEPKPWWKFW